jgi:magnesium transporter
MDDADGVRVLWVTADGNVNEGTRWPEDARHVWVDARRVPDETVLGRLFHPHPMALRQLAGDRTGNGLLAYPDAVVFVIEAPREQDPLDGLVPVRVALGRHFLVTVHPDAVSLLEDTWQLAREGPMLEDGADRVLYELLTGQLTRFRLCERRLLEDYEDIHRMLLEHPYRDLSHRILRSRRRFLTLAMALRPEVRATALLAAADVPGVAEEHHPYFQDVKNQVKSLMEEVDSTREGLSSTVEAYASVQSNEINKVMKFLTIISVLALPATTIASVYGMNFNIPETHWPFGYWYSLALMGSVTGSLLWYMNRHGWFR